MGNNDEEGHRKMFKREFEFFSFCPIMDKPPTIPTPKEDGP
jgi:hypothetical protein